MADIRSVQELYDLAKTEIQNQDPNLTDFNEGSLLDILTGVMATLVAEVQRISVDQFSKTFVETANGPEVTGGADDLNRLLVDHFGEEFSRPAAVAAEGVVTFSRATTGAGTVTIPAGTIVKTVPNAAGTSQRFATVADVSMTGLSVNASVTAVLEGSDGNALSGQVTVIESTLTDTTIVVTNSLAMSGGSDVADDSTYREFARNLLLSLRGATAAAIQAKALTVSGVEQAVPVEQVQTVIQYNDATHLTSGASFKIARNYVYIADANGTANAALIASVEEALEEVRACGVQVTVVGATAVTQNVTVSLILNGSGPNFADLSSSVQVILDDLTEYIQTLPIGTGFVRASAKAAVMAIWGPSGSNDLTAMTIVSPAADVSVSSTQTLVPGTIASQ